MKRVAILFLAFLGAVPLHAQQIDTASIDSAIEDARKAWQVPGVAVGIVYQDRLIYLRGFGVRELGSPEGTTPDTLFPIASCTKPFTSLALAMLVDEGRIAWDDPVRRHVPFFRLSDPLANANVTLRDLLTHRGGVAGHHMLWYRSPWGLEDRIRKVALLPLKHSFRSQFEYQSILFGTAGYAAGKAAGTNWESLIKERIFQPLGMKAACFTTPEARRSRHASPHRKNDAGQVERMPLYSINEPDPAGSIHASARDLVKFLRFQLGDGTWQGRPLVSEKQLAETHTPQIVIRLEDFAKAMNPDTDQLSYGLGWIVQDYRGQLLWMHGGAIDGFRAHFTLVPKAKLGIVLLNNLDRTQMNLALSNTLVDLFLRLPYKDWNSYYGRIMEAEDNERRERIKTAWQRRKDIKPSLPLTSFAGAYEDAAYGKATVSLEGDVLIWQWSTFRCSMKHFEKDTFVVSNEVFTDLPVTFSLSRDGKAESLRVFDREFRRASDSRKAAKPQRR